MFVPFESLPDSARIWIYQASRVMNDDEVRVIVDEAIKFVDSWTAHQSDLSASVAVFHNLFLVFSVDESHVDASGCSIDKKTHFIKQIEKQTGIDFFDRMRVAYVENNEVKILPLRNFASMVNEGKLSEETLIFNNLIFTAGDLRRTWKQPVNHSWIKQFLQINSN